MCFVSVLPVCVGNWTLIVSLFKFPQMNAWISCKALGVLGITDSQRNSSTFRVSWWSSRLSDCSAWLAGLRHGKFWVHAHRWWQDVTLACSHITIKLMSHGTLLSKNFTHPRTTGRKVPKIPDEPPGPVSVRFGGDLQHEAVFVSCGLLFHCLISPRCFLNLTGWGSTDFKAKKKNKYKKK